ncbi:hypothetical protein K070079E91_06500 [Eisenbergiella porci]|jgi:hypothetical protein
MKRQYTMKIQLDAYFVKCYDKSVLVGDKPERNGESGKMTVLGKAEMQGV